LPTHPLAARRRLQRRNPSTAAATASPTATKIHPHGVPVSDEAGSAATVSVGVVSVLVSGGVVVVSPLAAARASASQPRSPPLSLGGSASPVSVGTVLVVPGSVDAVSVSVSTVMVTGGGAVGGASAVVLGVVSVRVGRVGRVRLGREPVGTSAPDKPVTPLKPPPPQPAKR
jgi:hypothetical protein